MIFSASFVQAEEAAPDPKMEEFTKYFLEGYQLEQKKDFTRAKELYSKAIEISSESPAIFVRRAYCSAKVGDVDQIIADLRQADKLPPVSMTDYSTMAWLKATCPFDAVRDGITAVAYAQKVHEEKPSALSYDLMAAGYAEMGDFQRARTLLRSAIKRHSDSGRMKGIRERFALYKDKKKYRQNWSDGSLDKRDKKKLKKEFNF